MSRRRRKNRYMALKTWTSLQLIRLTAALSLAGAQRVGRAIGWLLYHTNNTNRRVARINIARCLPELSADQQEQLVRNCLRNLGMVSMEGGVAWLWPIERVRALIVEVTGEQLFHDAVARGKGLIIAGPHMGNWEVMATWIAARTQMTGLYRPPKMPALDDVITKSRERLPVSMVPADQSGVKQLLKELKAGRCIYALSDHEPSKGVGVFAPFFDQTAYTGNLVPKLAQRTGATVLITCAERLPNAAGFRLHFRPGPDVPADADDITSATALNAALANLIREFPEQFLWNYKRFRTRPDGEPRPY
ncbi:lysophospholipid acyltransferase family protein [Permianibacter sp. IMCC34836]|uniref:lysophospholipid acyltransferase family protein n=1 Tax=Permianibacter fluminis TaxID=2738515 RepID=UPI0015546FF8|nr:lysophospholipid acyltransferase family protein [Permianibacter fluminis]NQD36061.1 lysophospholipid acyltransferase family protein [Permianibacter fluminis]